ncbi:putative sulfate exporter family transporter [Desulfovibrio sp. Fe33]|uniref:putative sulfate exporter family transporter n=1 Tax=Desulfovibrio sp. Fe33 TaxID=3020842 RepID=UPI00234D3C3A|nr:putative sulfate exporter family transporter [Desulfovibrio sp. Fe33]
MNTDSMAINYELGRKSWFSALYGLKAVLPGLLAMFFVAIFSNNLAGVPNPFTLQNLFAWLDGVIGPVHHQSFFQVLNSNFVWNPLLLGLIIGNVFGVPDCWKRGLSYIHMLMPLGIIMLAPHFMIGHAFKLGAAPILICTAFLFLTATMTLWISKLFKLDDRHGSIIAGGLATGDPHVCAILMPLIKAKGGQVVHSTACVIGFGLVSMFLLPVLGEWMGLTPKAMGLASVVGVGNNAQSLFAAFGSSYEAGRWATWYDVGRHVIMPAGFLYVFIVMFVRKLRRRDDETVMATRGIKSFPIWLGVFVFLWVLACLHLFKEPAHHAIFEMVKWDFSLAAGALGLSMSFREITQHGLKGVAVTAVAGVLRIVLLLAAIALCAKTGLLAA